MADIWDRQYSRLQTTLEYAVLNAKRELSACESEIERALGVALIVDVRLHGASITVGRRPSLVSRPVYFIEPQVVIGSYRADFLVGMNHLSDDLRQCIVVECDGHEWHERTKEQAARDKARDRYLSAHVGRVIRFTGSEIFRDSVACAQEIAKVLHSAAGDDE